MLKTHRIILMALLGMLFSSTAFGQAEEAYEELLKANKYASRGAISRSIKHYEKVLELSPQTYPLAYFNLAEVYRAKGECEKAVMLYGLFAQIVADEGEKKEAKKAQQACSKELKTVTVSGKPEATTIKLNGYFWVSDQLPQPIQLMTGRYKLSFEAVDHLPDEQTIDVSDADLPVSFDLKKQTFFGEIIVGDIGIKGAKVRVFEGPSDKTKVLHEGELPMKEAIKVKEGKHFVEVVAPEHNRWIRNVTVGRDEKSEVKPKLTRSRPSELN